MGFVGRRHGKPRRPLRETGVVATAPLHRSAFTVSALFFRPTCSPNWVLNIFFPCRRRGFHANLLAVIHNRSATQREVQSGHYFRDLVIVHSIAVAIVGAHDVVVADYKRGPARGAIYRGNLLAEFGGRQL